MTAATAADHGPHGRQASSPGPVPLRPLRLAELLDAPFTLLQTDLRAIVLAAGVVIVPTQVLITWLQVRFTAEVLASPLLLGPGALGSLADDTADQLPGFLLVSLLSQILLLLAAGAVVRIGAARYWGRSEDARTALVAVGRHALPLIASRVLAYLVAGGGFLLAVVVGLLGAASGVTVVSVIGFLLAIPLAVLGVYLYVTFALSVPPIILEGAGPVTALRRSFRLVKGRWWPVFGVLLLSGFVIFIVGTALGSIPSVLGAFFPQDWYGWVLTGAGAILVSILVEPLLALVVLLLYVDLRIRKEGLDLQIISLAAPAAAAPDPSLWAPEATPG